MPMRQLRNCDFCGGDAAGVYEAIPAELSPTEAEQRRVVLCENCLGTLETVVDPLLSRLGVDRDADSAEAAEPTADAVPSADTASSDAESPTEATPSPEEAASTGDTSPADAAESRAAESAGESDSSASAASSDRTVPMSGFNAPEGYTDIAEYDGFQEPDEAGDPPSEAGDEAESPRARDYTPQSGDSPREQPPGETASSLGGASEEPEDFRTVMRLLGNREFPIPRSDVVELAGSAYQLDDAHVDRILDHAIDRGVLADEDGTLRKA
ncbi:hypothetical protein [Halobellus salinisoli]|uniref:hypothetical protein n=1 Tax=Halobellus salinisoli TaxID=3108500 RepID=UPI00300A54F6